MAVVEDLLAVFYFFKEDHLKVFSLKMTFKRSSEDFFLHTEGLKKVYVYRRHPGEYKSVGKFSNFGRSSMN